MGSFKRSLLLKIFMFLAISAVCPRYKLIIKALELNKLSPVGESGANAPIEDF